MGEGAQGQKMLTAVGLDLTNRKEHRVQYNFRVRNNSIFDLSLKKLRTEL